MLAALALIISLSSCGSRNVLTKRLFLLSGFPTVLGVLCFNSINCFKTQPCAKCHLFSAKSALRQKTLFNGLVSGVKWTKSCMTGPSCEWVPVQIYLTTVNWFEGSTRCATRFPFIPHQKSIKCILSGNCPREADVICFSRFWQKSIFLSFRQESRDAQHLPGDSERNGWPQCTWNLFWVIRPRFKKSFD